MFIVKWFCCRCCEKYAREKVSLVKITINLILVELYFKYTCIYFFIETKP